ncbi:hypothetical protein niasHT_037949 [Heterodera trifolii]|uniref:Uncharacterized protein n=1 Tax=Heterodera trifolii TaxID=157864 RepID=A0ABD2HNF1_9BILA
MFLILFFCASLANEWAKANENEQRNSDQILEELQQCHVQLSGILSAARSYQNDRQQTNGQIEKQIGRIEQKQRATEGQKKRMKNHCLRGKFEGILKGEKGKEKCQNVGENLRAISRILGIERSRFTFIMDATTDLMSEISSLYEIYEFCAPGGNCAAKKTQIYHHTHNIVQIWREFEQVLLPDEEYERMAREKAQLVTTTEWPQRIYELKFALLGHFEEDDSDIRSPKVEYSPRSIRKDIQKIVEKCETIVGTLFLDDSSPSYGKAISSTDRLQFSPSDSSNLIVDKNNEKGKGKIEEDTSPHNRKMDAISPKFEYVERGETSDIKEKEREIEEEKEEEEKEEKRMPIQMQRDETQSESAEFYSAEAFFGGKVTTQKKCAEFADQLRQSADTLDQWSKLAERRAVSREETLGQMTIYGQWVAAELGRQMGEIDGQLVQIKKERKKREKMEKRAAQRLRRILGTLSGKKGGDGGSQSGRSSRSSGSSGKIHAEEKLEVLTLAALANKEKEMKREAEEMPLKVNELAKLKKILESEILRYKEIGKTTEKLVNYYRFFAKVVENIGQMFHKEKMEQLIQIQLSFRHEIGLRMRVLRTDYGKMQSTKTQLVNENHLWLPWVEYSEDFKILRRFLVRQLIEEERNAHNSLTKITELAQKMAEIGQTKSKEFIERILEQKNGRRKMGNLCD